MKGFFIFLALVGVVVGGGYYAYTQGHLDPILGVKTTDDSESDEQQTASSGGQTTSKARPGVKADKNGMLPSPHLQPSTTSPSAPAASEPKTDLELKLEEKYPMPNFKPLVEIVDNWNSVPERAYPSAIVVNVEAEYNMYREDGSKIGASKALPGHKAKVLKFKPGKLLITNSPAGNTKAVVDIDDTDFKAQVQKLYDSKVAEARERILKARRVAKNVMLSQPAGGADMLAGGSSDDSRFQPVKDFLGAGKLESGILEEATEFFWLGSERHDNSSYDVVLVNFEVKTLFGVFPNSMKCLLRNGRVEKWIDAETGEERT